MNDHREELTNEELDSKLNRLESKVDLMIIRTDELILAYSTAKGITVFIKWLASLATASGIVWAALHGKIPS